MKEINFNVEDIEKIDLSMDVGIKEIYPPLENLEVVPTKQKQIFKHENSYGYDNVTINPISDEYIIPSGTLPITENTIYDVRKFAKVSASVHPAPNLQDKEVTPTKETQNITSDENYDGLNEVIINAIPDEYIVPNGTLDITTNGIHNVKDYENINANIIAVPTLEEKNITPTKEVQTVIASEGYDGLSQVTVNPIPSEYIVPSGELKITESGTYDVKEYASANVNVAGGSDSGAIPIYFYSDIASGEVSATSITISNAKLTNPKASTYNADSYKRTPDLSLIYAFVRGGGTYELSSNLTLIAETEWTTSTDGIIQKLIIAKGDLTSTNNYVITQSSSGRMQYGTCSFYYAGEPEVTINKIGATNDKVITASSPDDSFYMYVGSAIISLGANQATGGIINAIYDGDLTYINQRDRLFFCWTDRKTDLEFTLKNNNPYYQFLGLKIPYRK